MPAVNLNDLAHHLLLTIFPQPDWGRCRRRNNDAPSRRFRADM